MKKLYKSNTDKKISGVCGGIAVYFAVDSNIIRLVVAILTVFNPFIIFVYIIAALVIPKDNNLIE